MDKFKFGKLVIERYVVGSIEENTYLIYEEGGKEAIVVDPGEKCPELAEKLKELDFQDILLFITHGHGDHIGGVNFIRRHFPKAKVAVSKEDSPMLKDSHLNLSDFMGEEISVKEADIIIKEGDRFKVGSQEGVCAHIPGHTRGGMVLIFDNAVFAGDSLFRDNVGRSDLPGGNHKDLVNGIKTKILTLSDRVVFPGHGEETSVEYEKKCNPYLSEKAFFDY